ncbi:unnamed protein product [Amoebophrya sp. A120]|nr:unnamed protein product [Amoebophrya sp. A120]|eukprot:GSA120T00018670001.1
MTSRRMAGYAAGDVPPAADWKSPAARRPSAGMAAPPAAASGRRQTSGEIRTTAGQDEHDSCGDAGSPASLKSKGHDEGAKPKETAKTPRKSKNKSAWQQLAEVERRQYLAWQRLREAKKRVAQKFRKTFWKHLWRTTAFHVAWMSLLSVAVVSAGILLAWQLGRQLPDPPSVVHRSKTEGLQRPRGPDSFLHFDSRAQNDPEREVGNFLADLLDESNPFEGSEKLKECLESTSLAEFYSAEKTCESLAIPCRALYRAVTLKSEDVPLHGNNNSSRCARVGKADRTDADRVYLELAAFLPLTHRLAERLVWENCCVDDVLLPKPAGLVHRPPPAAVASPSPQIIPQRPQGKSTPNVTPVARPQPVAVPDPAALIQDSPPSTTATAHQEPVAPADLPQPAVSAAPAEQPPWQCWSSFGTYSAAY